MRTTTALIAACCMAIGGCSCLLPFGGECREWSTSDIERPPPSDLPGRGESGMGRRTPAASDRVQPRRDSLFLALRASLEATARAQEEVHTQEGAYTPDPARLALLVEYDTWPGVVVAIDVANDYGWSARATHGELRGHSCVISVGAQGRAPRINTARERRPGHADPGVVVCDSDRGG
jgi:hypothetical protein